MEKKTWAKLIIAIFLVVAIAVGIYLRWRQAGRGSGPLAGWGQGSPAIPERAYYESRILRIIENWQQEAMGAERDREGRMTESYKTHLVIDTSKQAIWIEQNGQIQRHNHTELPVGMEWKLYQFTPEGKSELPNQVRLKIRGVYSRGLSPEQFCLVGSGRRAGYLSFDFNAGGRGSGHGSGRFAPQPYNSKAEKTPETKDYYGSLVVTDAEYEQYRDSLGGSALSGSGEQSTQSETHPAIEENRASWLKAEKLLYIEVEKQVSSAGFELTELKVEPGPDFSAAHAELRATTHGFLGGIFGGYSLVRAYLRIDYLGNDAWYAKSHDDPERPLPPGRRLDLEFLVCPAGDIPDSQRSELIAKGREIQQSTPIPPPNWKATLANGEVVEFIGICENPSAGKQWWGPDGSPLDYVPYINTKPYGRPRENRRIYEFAWRIKRAAGSSATTHSLEGSKGSYYRQIHDRYGNRIIEGLRAQGYGFDKSRQKTTLKIGLSAKNWQTALSIEDEAGEIEFLEKQRIILNPPTIENGQIVVRCYEEYRSHVSDHQTDFGLIFKEDSATKTVSLDQYEEDTTVNEDTGLREHKFIIDKLRMVQIEGVCFRHRPFEFVKFKNISLIPGKDQGCKIEFDGQ